MRVSASTTKCSYVEHYDIGTTQPLSRQNAIISLVGNKRTAHSKRSLVSVERPFTDANDAYNKAKSTLLAADARTGMTR